MPKISLVMPAYDVGNYIRDAIESIIVQSFEDWELIIVDDKSNDSTVSIVERYKALCSRIRLIKRRENSGGCRLPRFDGILAAKGEFVCCIDADDFIEADYLKKLINRQTETNATAVLGRMFYTNSEGHIDYNRSIPTKDADMNAILSGTEVCKNTIGGWNFAMAGALINTTLYQEHINNVYDNGKNLGFADEIDHRRILLRNEIVAMTDAHYFYRQQPNSVIHSISVKRFHELTVARDYYFFVKEHFADDVIIMQKVSNEFVEKLYRCRLLYLNNKTRFSSKERNEITSLVTNAFSFMKSEKMTYTGKKYSVLASTFTIFRLFTYIVYTILKYHK